MADNNNPIKYSDLIQPDNSITELIAQLEKLMATYAESANLLKSEAIQVKASIQSVSGATEQGRTATKNASTEAERLAKAQEQLSQSTSATAVELARLKQAQKEANDIAKLTAKINEAEEGSYNKLSAQYSLNKIRLNAMSAEMRKNTAEGQKLEAETKRIYDEMKNLQEATGKYQLNVGNYADASKSLKTQLRELTLQMAELASNGQKGSAQWNELAQRAGAVKDAMSDASTAINKYASDSKVLDDVVSVAKTATGAYGVYTSAVQVFGEENEKVTEGIRKLQAVQTMLISLQSLANQLTTDGTLANKLYHATLRALNLEKKIDVATTETATVAEQKNIVAVTTNTTATTAEAVANTADTTAKGANTAATWALTTATHAFGVALKAIGIGLIISAIVVLVDALGGMEKIINALIYPIKLVGEGLSWCADKIKGVFGATKDSTSASKENAKALEAEAKATKELADKKKQLEDEITEQIAKYKILQAQWDNTKTLEERKKFIKDYAGEMKQLGIEVNSVSDAEIAFSTKGLQTFAKSMEIRAQLTILQERLVANLRKQEQALIDQSGPLYFKLKAEEQEILQSITMQSQALNELQKMFSGSEGNKTTTTKGGKTGNPYVDSLLSSLAEGEKELKHFYAMLKAEGKQNIEDQITEVEELYNMRRNAYSQLIAHTSQEMAKYKEGSEQRKELEKQYDEYSRKLTEYRYEYEEKTAELTTKIRNDNALAQLKLEKESIELRLQAVRTGSDEEMRLKEQQVENLRQIALAQNAMLEEKARQNADDINAVYNERLGKLADTWVTQQKALFEKEQALAQSEFDLLETSEGKKTRFRLNAEKDRIKKILELNAKASTKLSDIEVKTLLNTLKKLDKEIEQSVKDEKGDIWGVLGIDLPDKKKQAIATSFDFVKEQLSSVMENITANADKAVDASQKEVDAMQSRLDAELQARANGYASNVEQAQKDLELAKKTNAKAREEQAKAQRQQQAIQSLEQMGNLVTASSLIWSQLGFPWAIPAIATMWGSFAFAKVKALQVTRQGTEQYGEGTVELLEGGSHQSGNDIDLGTKADGTRRRAEGGEFFAVINKRNSRKYRNVIPDVINSLNNGTFASKYMSAFEQENQVINLNGNSPDISELNANVRAIKEQGMSHTYTDGRGRMVMQYKNVTRIYSR